MEQSSAHKRNSVARLGTGQLVGKYRLSRRLGEGGSGEVWKALDTVEGIWVALKIPLPNLHGETDHQALRREVRLVASLRHNNILPIKNADLIDGRVVLATELSVGTLADRHRPMAARRVLRIMDQVLKGLAYAHSKRVVHCDVTPGNIFLFPDGRAALGDFGISRVMRPHMATMDEFGTPGYVAPEQAYGKPTFGSDCFSAAVITYEYITGYLPRWPFEWPIRGADRLQARTNWALTRVLRKGLEVSPRKRYPNAAAMRSALVAAVPVLQVESGERTSRSRSLDWRRVRRDAFIGRYGRVLDLAFDCVSCAEPVAECMEVCPWCAESDNHFGKLSPYPYYCPSCSRGLKGEWPYCPWCYGGGFDPLDVRPGPDKRYRAKCSGCSGKLMPFMSFCPWCRLKVRRKWHMHPFPHRCRQCRWSVDGDFWSYCPWCATAVEP